MKKVNKPKEMKTKFSKVTIKQSIKNLLCMKNLHNVFLRKTFMTQNLVERPVTSNNDILFCYFEKQTTL